MNDTGWKILTHDLRPPIQGGNPLWVEGVDALPIALSAVVLDTTAGECAAGWNYCATLADAVRITGLFRVEKPMRAFAVTAPDEWIERGGKRRAATLRVEREATPADWQTAFTDLSAQWFPDHVAVMAAEQTAWWQALTHPGYNPAQVEAGLRVALAARGLDWTLRRYDSERDLWAARAAWDAWDARAAWAARDARDARAARAAWAAWAARDARAAWAARDARDARDAWAAWAARDALTTQYAALQGWITAAPDRHTVGIRDAYAAGLAVALPVAKGVLGWVMREDNG